MSESLDLSKEIDSSEKKLAAIRDFHPEKEKLNLAKHTLLWLAGIFIISMICQMFSVSCSDKVFDITSHGIPPIVTLILGYYFSKS